MGVTHYPCLDLYRGGTRVDRFVVRNPRDADTMSAWLSTHIGVWRHIRALSHDRLPEHVARGRQNCHGCQVVALCF